MSFSVTEQLGRCPTFAELQALAGQHDVCIHGNELAGNFCHPNSNQPKVTGHYTFEANGEVHGDFTAQVMGKLAGNFALAGGKAEVMITEKPFLLSESVLKARLSVVLKDFCGRFQ